MDLQSAFLAHSRPASLIKSLKHPTELAIYHLMDRNE